MKLFRSTGVLLLAVFALAACDDDDTTGVEIADLAGFWNATQFEYSDGLLALDAISIGGGTVTLDVQSDGAFDGSIRVPGLTVDDQGQTTTVPISGTLSVSGNTLSVDFDAQTLNLLCEDPANPDTCLFSSFDATFTLDGDVLTFVNDDTTFDFPDSIEESVLGGARGPVDATLTATFER